MYLKKALRITSTLAFRLTLWYAGIFTISTFFAFIAFYFLIATAIQDRRNKDLLEDVEEYSQLFKEGGIERVKAEMSWEAASDGARYIFLRLLTLDGREYFSTDMSSWKDIKPSPKALERLTRGEKSVIEKISIPEREHEVCTVYGNIGPGMVFLMGKSLEEDAEFLEIFKEVFVPIMIAVTIIAALIGWIMARRALGGVEEVTQIALKISKGSIDKRVSIIGKEDEIKRLAAAFNTMLDRIHASMEEMKALNNNIAHDLRSPLARIRGLSEMALINNATNEENKALAASMIEECDRLLEMINTMLDIAEAESGVSDLVLEEVDMTSVVKNACELFRAVAEEKHVNIVTILPESCIVRGDPRKLQRLTANLLDNALKYTPAGGSVAVSVNDGNGYVAISFSDTGIGIAEADLPHIFKRFYRSDKSRTETGSGLGLSLVMAIARSHDGDVNVKSHLGKGSAFTVMLPKLKT